MVCRPIRPKCGPFIFDSGLFSILNVLELFAGLDAEKLAVLGKWSAGNNTVSLSISATERCTFLRTTTRKEESATQDVTERTGFFAGISTRKTFTTIVEHFWKFQVEWSISAFAGVGDEKCITLIGRQGSCEVMTVGKEKRSPAPEIHHPPDLPKALDFSWFMAQVTAENSVDFRVDRTCPLCHTPRRNKQSDGALDFLVRLSHWSSDVFGYISRHMQREKNLNPRPSTRNLFSPIHGMFTMEEGGSLLSREDMEKFLEEHRRQLGLHKADVAAVFPAPGETAKLYTVAEMGLLSGLFVCQDLCKQGGNAVGTVEIMLHRQVVAAIGKEVCPRDVTDYMEYHCRQLLREDFQPKGFCYAVRRPDHFPEGTVSIEYDRGTAAEKNGQPLIRTVVHSSGESEPSLAIQNGGGTSVRPMKFALDAATNVTFGGERHLHACVMHQFSDSQKVPLRLLARARQFSSFIILVGKIASADLFEPTGALIIRDKDDLEIPLMLETMPTPKGKAYILAYLVCPLLGCHQASLLCVSPSLALFRYYKLSRGRFALA
jgi:hypothetical protein